MIDKETSMDALKNFVENFVKERDWSQFHSPKNISMALAIEASELMDIFKWDTEKDSKVKINLIWMIRNLLKITITHLNHPNQEDCIKI